MSEHQPPDFDELIGSDLDPDERERLRRVHEMLVLAGPPPELPPSLEPVPEEQPVRFLPRRRRLAVFAIAAALALVAFGGGYLVGDRTSEPSAFQVVPMTGVGVASTARASLAIFDVDNGGNWPMELTVRGLRPLPAHRTYSLWLVKNGRADQLCGTFVVAGDKTVVSLNAPYKLKEYEGWVVTRSGSTTPLLST